MNNPVRAKSSTATGAARGPQDDAQTNAPQDERTTKLQIDYIDEALEESVPSSDPPALTPSTQIGPTARDAAKGRA